MKNMEKRGRRRVRQRKRMRNRMNKNSLTGRAI